MNTPNHLEILNPAQQEAVTAASGNLLILAGAGSGKTRVLVHRIAWLLQHQEIVPYNILAVTFTNKAANEMRNRLDKLVAIPVSNMWVGTFHGLAHRLLRTHWQEAGLSQNFQIIDSEDQMRLIKQIHKTMNLDDEKWPIKKSQWFINNKKDEGLRPDKISTDGDFTAATLVKVYEAYNTACHRNNLLDFAELLLRAYELLQGNADLLAHYQQRFRHILVDEFQDTNSIQYAWIKLIAGSNSYLTIVGDDDQSIYGWRGAKIENILRIKLDFPDTKTVRMEQNYRSTGNILAAANALIANNHKRMGKKLWTAGESGEQINLYTAINEIDEAKFVVKEIHKYLHAGTAPNEIAVLYRSNAQSRVFEEELMKEVIPYAIYGGYKFFERAEIKDTLAYLRLLVNPNDDQAFERIINLPARGIGETTLAVLREKARNNNSSLWNAAQDAIKNQELGARASAALSGFLGLVKKLIDETAAKPLDEQINQILQQSGLYNHFKKDNTDKGEMRIENLDELISAARQFIADTNEGAPHATAFLARVALEAGDTESGKTKMAVQLMTLHSAKGLEFPILFLVGMEMGLFPHQMSFMEPDKLEEERRLCYVGITRAMSKLFLTCAQVRRLHGVESYRAPSKFLREIPAHLIKTLSNSTLCYPKESSLRVPQHKEFASKAVELQKTSLQNSTSSKWQIGQRVHHQKFGTGKVLDIEGQDEREKIKVNFDRHGAKWLVAMYANLQG